MNEPRPTPRWRVWARLGAGLFSLVVLVSLARNAGWLTEPAPGLPQWTLGTLGTWIMMGIWGWLAWEGAVGFIAKTIAGFALALALAWVPVSALIAGNWAYDFEDADPWRFRLWMWLSVVTGAAGLVAAGAAVVSRWWRRDPPPASSEGPRA